MTTQERAFLADTRAFVSRAEDLLKDANSLSRDIFDQTAPRQRDGDIKPIGRANKELLDAREHLLETISHLKSELKRLEQ